jgi:hypothetical protein
MGCLIYRCSTRVPLNHKLNVSVRWHTLQFLREDIGKLIDHWHLRSLNSIHLAHLCTISNTLGSDYRLCAKFQFLPIQRGQLDRLLGAVDKYLVLTKLVHSKNDVNALSIPKL